MSHQINYVFMMLCIYIFLLFYKATKTNGTFWSLDWSSLDYGMFEAQTLLSSTESTNLMAR